MTEHQTWPKTGHARRAGVSGYGYGGTIGHVVLEEAPAPVSPEGGGGGGCRRAAGGCGCP
ncbi:hypothetical protein GCM10020000_84780 [Streptomyces olivoverticillatus]